MTAHVPPARRGRSVSIVLFSLLLLMNGEGRCAPQGVAPGDSTAATGDDGPRWGRIAIVGGVYAAGVTAIHIYQRNAWWKGERGPFHVEEDLVYAKNIDKVGHFYGAQLFTFTISKSLQWANIPESRSLVYGAAAATLFQTYVEVEDGFAREWGFDRVDFLGDVMGAWYPVAQHEFPVLRNFDIKFSYLPKTPSGAGAFPDQRKTLMDDYEGQTFWLAIRLGRMIDPWPRWLNVSVGLAVRENLTPHRYLAVFLAPDLDLRSILPRTSSFLTLLGEALDYIHMPLPAIRISPGIIWYGLYF